MSSPWCRSVDVAGQCDDCGRRYEYDLNENVTLDGLILSSSGAVTFGDAAGDALTLATSSVTINTTGAEDGLTVNSTVAGGSQDLILGVAGATVFNAPVANVGDGVGGAITINSTGTTSFESTVGANSGIIQAVGAGLVTFKDNVTLAAGDDSGSTFNENVVLDGMTLASDSDLTFGSAAGDSLTLSTGAVTINTTGAGDDLTVNATVAGGAQDLTLGISGATIFNAPVANVGDGVGAAITINSVGTTSFESTVGANSGITQAVGAGAVTFKDDVTLAVGDDSGSTFNENVVLDGLTVTSASDLTFGSAAGDSLTLSTGAVTINTTGAGDDLTVNATVAGGSQDLTLGISGTTVFNAPVANVGDGVGAAITINSVGTTSFESTVGANSGIIQAVGAGLVTFKDNVTLGAGTTAVLPLMRMWSLTD